VLEDPYVVFRIRGRLRAAARDAAMRAGGTEPPPDPEYDVGVFKHDSDGTVKRPAGLREPQGVVAAGGRTGLFDDVVGWGFTLALRGVDPLQSLSAVQRAFLERIGCHVVQLGSEPGPGVTVECDDAYERFCSEHGIIGFLSRPDFRIFAGVSDPADLPELVADLERQLYVLPADSA